MCICNRQHLKERKTHQFMVTRIELLEGDAPWNVNVVKDR